MLARRSSKTVKTVELPLRPPVTPLKRGVNERRTRGGPLYTHAASLPTIGRMAQFALATLLLASVTGLADSPSIKYLLPSAVAPGKTTEITFFGSNLGAATNLWTSFDASTEHIRSADDRAVFKISIPAKSSTGFGAVRLAGTNGLSSFHLLMIDPLPNRPATGTNHSLATAQTLKLPLAVEGACQEKTSEFFKFSARKSQSLSFEVVAQRLGSALDPLVRLLDPKGRELVFCEDTPGAGADCRFIYKFQSSGEYVLELRDTRYEGGQQHRYRLRAGDWALEPAPLPFHVKSEFAKPISLLPQINEIEPNDLKGQEIPVPVCIIGHFQKAKDRDCFQFTAQKDQRLVFHGKTRSLGSPCDLYLRLETADGQKLAESPMAGADEGNITNTFKETSLCRLIIEEAAELSGPECFYRVEIEPFHRGFALSVDSEKVQAPAGGSFEIKVTPERRDYDGPITLALDGAGEGFEIVTNVITAKTNATTMKVNVPATLQPGDLIHFKITGHAKIDGHDFVTTASTRPALRKLFPHLLWPPAELDGWIALGITPQSIPAQRSHPISSVTGQ